MSQAELNQARKDAPDVDGAFVRIRRTNCRGETQSNGGRRKHEKFDVKSAVKRQQETFVESYKLYDFFEVPVLCKMKAPKDVNISTPANQRKFIEETLKLQIVEDDGDEGVMIIQKGGQHAEALKTIKVGKRSGTIKEKEAVGDKKEIDKLHQAQKAELQASYGETVAMADIDRTLETEPVAMETEEQDDLLLESDRTDFGKPFETIKTRVL